jgi:hypothetical protein
VNGLSINFTYTCHCVSLVSNDNERYTSLLSGLIIFLAAECYQDREQSGGGNTLLDTVKNWLCVYPAWGRGLRINDPTQSKDFLTTLDFNLDGRVIAGSHR